MNETNAALSVKTQKVNTVRALLAKMKDQFAAALPKHLPVERLMRVAITAMQRNPKLLDCTQESLAGALMTAAQLGLEPDGTLGRGYLIPRNNRKAGTLEANFQPGYQGLLDLCHRSGEIASVRMEVVRKGDFLKYEKGTEDRLEHREAGGNWDAVVTHVYAVIKTRNGGCYWDVWSADKVEAHRKRFSKDTRDDSAWSTDWPGMAKKTVLTAVMKLAPKSIEQQIAVAAAEQDSDEIPADFTDVVDVTEKPSGPPKTLDEVKERAKQEKAEKAAEAAKPVQQELRGHLQAVMAYEGMLGENLFWSIVKEKGGSKDLPNLGLGGDGLKALLDACVKAVG